MPERYCGPTTLEEALKDSGMAISCPNGEYLALPDQKGGELSIRRLHRVSGHGGSVLDTGEWVDVKDVPPTILWRPA